MAKVEDAFKRNPAEFTRLDQCALGELLQDFRSLVTAHVGEIVVDAGHANDHQQQGGRAENDEVSRSE